MKLKGYNTHEELTERLNQNSEFSKAERLIKPYYDLVRQIIKRRSELKITQKELAKLANTFQSRISKIESAEHDIRLSTLIKIAEALQTEVLIQLVPITKSENYYLEPYQKLLFQSEAVSPPQGKSEEYSKGKENKIILPISE